MQIHVSPNIEGTLESLANWITQLVEEGLEQNGKFSIALSGGSTPKALYELLSSQAYSNRIDWLKVDFFWGDERYVPFEDSRNNAHMAYDALLGKVPVTASKVHRMETGVPPEQSAQQYAQLLHEYFDTEPYTFDLVLLGLGDNGHTLSLFPHEPILTDNESWVRSFWLTEQNMYRITLMHTVVNRAKSIAFLVTGENKATMVEEVIMGREQPMQLPAQLIKPESGTLHWYLDGAAAAKLPAQDQ